MKMIMTPLVIKDIETYYTVDDIDKIINEIGDVYKYNKPHKNKYYNIACSFDIETSSFYINAKKQVIMYMWSFCITGYVILGRTWNEFDTLYYKLAEYFKTDQENILIIYVHNLSYEFQFIRKRFDWLKVFSLEKRKPLQCTTIDGIEFRCSYLLSGYSLETLASQLHKYKVNKLKGYLDYDKIRTPLTPLTKNEIQYSINDSLVVCYYIQELIERDGGIHNIPLTKTGYVRNYCRNNCLYDKEDRFNRKFHNYRAIMKSLTLDVATYEQLKRAFSGGFTHANPFYSKEIMEDVDSFDFTSSYPYVMISEKFPMSSFIKVKISSINELNDYLKCYCCLFDIEFINIDSIEYFESYISTSHCYILEDCVENNGRVVSAERLKITITEQDYAIIKKMYKWKEFKISNFRISKKGYLPKNLVLSILKLYVDKTELKGVIDRELDYMQSKERINACYGMTVTDICRDDIIYDDEWSSEEPDMEKTIASYNKSIKRFLFYGWGIWVTAYARKNLFSGILEFKDDYIYSDTDSIKVVNLEKHIDYINWYNELVIRKLEKAMMYHNIPIDMTKPKNIKGEEKQIGIWEHEDKYKFFKTLGAKRYMTMDYNNNVKLTVAGVNKNLARDYLVEYYKESMFERFDDNLIIPQEYTGKLIHTYIDEEMQGCVVDYLGNTYNYHELSGTHLEKTSYSLSMSEKYVDYILGVKNYEK